MSKLEVRMSPEDRDRLKRVAEERGLKVSELVRESLAAHLAVEERSAASAHGPGAVGSRIAPEPSEGAGGVASEPRHPEGANGSDSLADAPPPPEAVDLAVWLSERVGLPRSLARARILQGRVAVDGVPHLELEVPNPPTSVQLDGVELCSG